MINVALQSELFRKTCYTISIPSKKDGDPMRRNALEPLKRWKTSEDRNFDGEDELKSIFETNKNPRRIIELLSLIAGEKILPGETLIIFDEIEDCLGPERPEILQGEG